MLGVKKGKVFSFSPTLFQIYKHAIFLNTAGKGLRLGATSQTSGTALKNPAAASLPSRALGGAAQGQGLPRGSLKALSATEKDDGFDVDDWFKDYEVDPEDVDDGQPRSQSPASATQDNKEDDLIDIENPAPLPAHPKQPHPKSQQQPASALEKPITAKETPRVEEPLASEEEDQQQRAEDASEEMECELAAENDKAKEEEAATLTAKKTDNSKATSNKNSVDETEEKQLSSDDDLGSLLGIEKADDDDEVMAEAPSAEKALPPAPSKAAKEAEDGAANQKIPSFQFPNLNSRLPNNNNKPRVPSRLGPGRSAPPLPGAAAAALAAKDAAVGGDAIQAAKENANKINENLSPLFPSATTTKSPALASLADGKRKLAAGATPTPITPAEELQAHGGAAVITPGTESPLDDSTEKDAPGAKAANPQTAATTSPATTPPAPPAVDLGDDLLRIDYSARGEQFLLSLEDEEAATQEALATPTAKKVFSLSTSVASAGVDTESLSKRVEDVEVNLAMMRLRYTLDAVEVSIKAPRPAAAAAECLPSGGGDGDGGGVNNEEEAMEIDIIN